MIHRVIAEVDRGTPILVKELDLIKGESLEEYEDRVHKVEHVAIVEGTNIIRGIEQVKYEYVNKIIDSLCLYLREYYEYLCIDCKPTKLKQSKAKQINVYINNLCKNLQVLMTSSVKRVVVAVPFKSPVLVFWTGSTSLQHSIFNSVGVGVQRHMSQHHTG